MTCQSWKCQMHKSVGAVEAFLSSVCNNMLKGWFAFTLMQSTKKALKLSRNGHFRPKNWKTENDQMWWKFFGRNFGQNFRPWALSVAHYRNRMMVEDLSTRSKTLWWNFFVHTAVVSSNMKEEKIRWLRLVIAYRSGLSEGHSCIELYALIALYRNVMYRD